MANTWTYLGQSITFVASKLMSFIYNGGARVLRIRRIGLQNTQTVAVVGVKTTLQLRRYTASGVPAGSAAGTAYAHDTTNSALSSVTVGAGGTAAGTGPSVFRTICWSTEEPKLSTTTWDEWETIVPFNVIWDAGYGLSSTIQPLVCRNAELYTIHNGTGAAGNVMLWWEFTDEVA